MSDENQMTVTQSSQQLADDGGYASRKFWLVMAGMGLIFLCFLLTNWFTALAAQLAVVIGGFLGAIGLYMGANVTTKFAAAGVAKNAANMAAATATAQAEAGPVSIKKTTTVVKK